VAVGVEFTARSGASWWHNWWWLLPAAFIINFALYRVLQTDASWVYSLVLFSAITNTFRIGLAFFVLHEPVTPSSLAAGAALLAAVLIRIVWR
jgi:hypothetical protein